MALRVRELNRRETVVERQAREEEQLILRKLEDCKRTTTAYARNSKKRQARTEGINTQTL